MIISGTLVVLAAALTATATKVHNQFGLPFWVQDNAGKDHYLNDGGSVTINGGWGFFWTNNYSGIDGCHQQNSASFSWPSGYGDVYLKSDGHLRDAGGSQLGSARINLNCS